MMNLEDLAYVAVRKDVKTGNQFFDLSTLGSVYEQAKNRADDEDRKFPGLNIRSYPVLRIVQVRIREISG